MKLLFDENLSPQLVRLQRLEYPDSTHVTDLDLQGTPDTELWAAARERDLVIVTKDDDFRELSFVYGAPPKVVWLQIGNAGTQAVAAVLREHLLPIQRFVADPEDALLVLPTAHDTLR